MYPQAGYPVYGYQAAPVNYQAYGFGYNPYDPAAWANASYFQAAQHPSQTFSAENFQKLRNHKTKASAIQQLNEIGCDCMTTPIELFTHPIARVCFCCVNTYTTAAKELGVGPLCDAITVGANHRLMGYFVYYLHNPKPATFMAYLKMFLRMTTENLTVYYMMATFSMTNSLLP